ncbi:hypothetical protein FACS1894113_0750 [Alphaproteobacteria bacterium]|nr:hypothetical protein FACS1894113_0750 [Alphaproteobacteria bacterium]
MLFVNSSSRRESEEFSMYYPFLVIDFAYTFYSIVTIFLAVFGYNYHLYLGAPFFTRNSQVC